MTTLTFACIHRLNSQNCCCHSARVFSTAVLADHLPINCCAPDRPFLGHCSHTRRQTRKMPKRMISWCNVGRFLRLAPRKMSQVLFG
jgi:hypothetical protein